MTQFVTLAAVQANREQLGTPGQEIWRTMFLQAAQGTRLPQAFLIEYATEKVLRLHFHDVDEFQVVLAGSGRLGPHLLFPCVVHFARAHTGYGPVVAGPKGLSFLTLRARRDSAGPQLLPERRDALMAVAGRQPWQVTSIASFANSTADVPLSIHSMPAVRSAQGLAAYTVSAQPHIEGAMPAANGSAGQYVTVLDGSAWINGVEHAAVALGFVKANEPPLLFTAGSRGFKALVFNFPQSAPAP